MTTTIELSWRDLIIRADPNHVRDSLYVTEYEFTAPSQRQGDPRTHEGGKRVFKANYQNRGPYADD